jgi:hypothetical protein
VIDVTEKEVERGDALDETSLDGRPFGRRHQPWQEIERKDALHTFGLTVDGKGDSLRGKGDVSGALAFPPLLYRQTAETLVDAVVLRTTAAGPIEHLVVRLPERVASEHR